MQTLFSTPEREKVLRFILNNPEKEIKVRELSKKLGVNAGFVSVFLQILRKEKIVINNKINIESPQVRSLKILLNIETLNLVPLIIKKEIKDVIGIGVFGAYAHGENFADSDIDLWLKVKKMPLDLSIAKIKEKLKNALNTDVDLYVATSAKLQKLSIEDHVFYSSLLNSFLLLGEPLDKF